MVQKYDDLGTSPLKLYWNAKLQDHLLVASETSHRFALQNGYTLIRTVGMVYNKEITGGIPLHLMFSTANNDHVLTAAVGELPLHLKGYKLKGIEGWIPSVATGGIPLRTYWCEDRRDSLGVADAETAKEIANPSNGKYVIKRIEGRILPTSMSPRMSPRSVSLSPSASPPRSSTGYQSSVTKAIRPTAAAPKQWSKAMPQELHDFDKMPKEELRILEKATITIQRIFRGHQVRTTFGQFKLKPLWGNVLSKAIEHDAAAKKMNQLSSALNGLNESLLTLGADAESVAALKGLSTSVREQYQAEIKSTLDKREAARARMNSVVEEKNRGSFLNVFRDVSQKVLQFIGLLHGQDIDEQLDSQQTAWQTEPVFKFIVEGNFDGLITVVSQDESKMRLRDHLGAPPLCVCLLLNTDIHLKMARWLLKRQPSLAEDTYTNDFFKGECALHFTIIHRDIEMSRLLLEAHPEGLLQRATGEFFQDRITGTYFGEWPLMFAISSNQPEMVLMFLDFAEKRLNKSRCEMLDDRDSDLNTVLHMCVWHNLPEMYEFIEQLCKQKPQPAFYECGLTQCINKDGLTPFSMAAKLGHEEIFAHLLESNTQVAWKYGPHSYRAVFIDEIEPAVGSDRPSILQLLVDLEHKDLLALPLIRNFLTQKWNTYVRKIFLSRILMVAFYVFAFVIAGFKERGVQTKGVPAVSYESFQDFISSFQEMILWELSYMVSSVWIFVERLADFVVFTGALWKGKKELGELNEGGIQGYFGVKGSMLLENILSCSCCLMTLSSYILRVYESDLEDLCGAASALLLWSYVLWLMLGFKQTGPFIIMIWKMLSTDMVQFFTIFVVFAMGFTQAFHMILNTDPENPYIFFSSLRTSVEVLLGEVSLDVDEKVTNYPIVAYVMMVVYVILVTILLLNLLVAMMSTTYSEIQDEADVIWNMEFSRLILSLESEMTTQEKLRTKWWTIVEGRRCFMLPMLTEEGKHEFWKEWEPDWDQAYRMGNAPLGWSPPGRHKHHSTDYDDLGLRGGSTPREKRHIRS